MTQRWIHCPLAALLALCVAIVGLVSTSGVSQAARHALVTKPYYLSLGDSYSIGYQPGFPGGGGSPGFTKYVATYTGTTLENFGCGGATTGSLLSSIGCGDPAATNAVAYPTTTQEQAALAFIAAHPGKVGQVTVEIGGNDITGCVSQPTQALIVACVVANAATMQTNVTTLVGDLAAALSTAGDTTARIFGLTYPDVILGDYVFPSGSPNVALANLSVTAFDSIVNPDLLAAYSSVGVGRFVNVTMAPYLKATTGDDTPLTMTTKLLPYGVIPDSVWEICKLTYFCTLGNIHANSRGYTFIGKLVVTQSKLP